MADVVSDSAFPDRIGIAGGPLIPCRVTEFSITTAPTATIREYYDGGAIVRDQAAQHVIRYEVPHGAPHPSPAPGRIEASWMTGAGEVRIAAIDLIADPRPDRTAGQRLDEAIRARLEALADWDDITLMLAALIAVLDLHQQAYALVYDVPRDPSGEPRRELHPWCVCQERDGMTGEERRPCETVRAVAKELGVETDHA